MARKQYRAKVYLAGPISDVTYDECMDWRDYAKKFFKPYGILGVSPMRGKDYFKELMLPDETFNDKFDSQLGGYEGLKEPMSTAKAIFNRDKWDVWRCDLILAHLTGAPKASIGTVMELSWAHVWNKLVVATLLPDEVHNHGMLIQTMGIVVETLEEALQVTVLALGE